jgi:hypothetical protein
MKKKGRTTESAKKLVATVGKDMQEPRLAASVREAGEDPTPPTYKKPASHAA